ncbi:MAG: glycoside hydrolase family 15 protein [Halofilum sp. (in: g-proteobacteria)]|nr:glycoside hydrolase family 15 protein [Halofilum sp. (in: g-proteobacteria)]
MTADTNPNAAPSLELGLIGNCRISALVDGDGCIVWGCFPRLDGDPVFSALVNGTRPEAGFFAIDLLDVVAREQYYLRNSAILCTELTDRAGNRLRITDFAPRFSQYDRRFRPLMLIRRLEAVEGSPTVRVRLRPHSGHGSASPRITQGSNHLRFVGDDHVLRLTTDVPLTHVLQEQPFLLDGERTLVLGPDESLTASPDSTGRDFLAQTRNYWLGWCRSLAVPFEWQSQVIRAAITLKLSTFDDTGAMVAATTTSIPEAADSGRNWDYRFCWLRDAWFTVHALNRLGATGTLERYLYYIINLVIAAPDADLRLQPMYGLGGERDLAEREAAALAGYRGHGPVRIGNDAWRQVQHDVYGSVVLAATHAFFDQRLAHPGDVALYRRLVPVGERAVELHDQPDAGIWEYRGRTAVHTHSAVMCWAACDRLARIARHLGLEDDATGWQAHADHIHEQVCARAWDAGRNTFTADLDGNGALDASLLLLNELGFLAADDPRFVGTVEAVERELRRGDHLLRYAAPDDFGDPQNAFNVCTFWFIDALHAIGRHEEARRLFENLLACCSRLGMLSEDLDPDSGEMWGNFPQTYSMVGLIHSALRLSCSWEERT